MEHSFYDFLNEYEDVTDTNTENSKWLLGVKYSDAEQENFIRDFSSIIWCSYRKDFPQMSPYPFTSDRGWGCMLRAAQMILAQGLSRHKFRRAWRVPMGLEERKHNQEFCKLLEWFVDHKEDGPLECLFSLHKIVQCGMQYDMLPGEWYGPSNAIKVLRDLWRSAGYADKIGEKLVMHVCDGGSIYKEKIDADCGAHTVEEEKQNPLPSLEEGHQEDLKFYDPLLNPPQSLKRCQDLVWEKSLLLFLPLRLGIADVSSEYRQGLLKTFECSQSLGIIGGRPNHAIYFVGYENQMFLGLDPHTVQPSPSPVDFPSDIYLNSVHREDPQRMAMDILDPSLALGFYCRDRDEFLDLCIKLDSIKNEEGGTLLPISISNAPPAPYNDVEIEAFDEGVQSDVEDDFVIIEKHI